jgi:arsenite methyltransferase
VEDFLRLCHKVGFTDPRILETSEIKIKNEELQEVIGNIKFVSITFRLFKLQDLETKCEDYGQYAVYHGKLQGNAAGYLLDDHHFFETNKPLLVCGNTSSMLHSTWLSKYFTVVGSRDVHYGAFDCSKPVSSNKIGGCC